MKVLSKEDILAANDLKLQPFEVPEWGGSIYIRVMSGNEREAYEQWAAASGKDSKHTLARIASLCICDESGKLLFNEDDIVALNGKNVDVLLRITTEVTKLNALTKKDIEDLSKNSSAAPSDSSSSV